MSKFILNVKIICLLAGADTGFPVGGGTNPPGGGHQHKNLPDLSKNCMKLRKFWSVGGGAVRRERPPLHPPLVRDF